MSYVDINRLNHSGNYVIRLAVTYDSWKIWESVSGVIEDLSVLGFYATWTGKWLPVDTV